MMHSLRTVGATVSLLMLAGCALLTEPVEVEAPSVVGIWTLTATQSAPALILTGTMMITTQRGAEILGTATWEERDGVGVVALDGGPIAGRFLSSVDLDFDITLASGERRMLAVISADTIAGTWAQPSLGRSGTFRAVRSNP